MNDFDPSLGRLLDEAADAYRPAFDPARLQRDLAGRRRRGFVLLAGVAAGLAVIGGTVFAFHVDGDAGRLQPANETPPVSSERPKEPPFGRDTTLPDHGDEHGTESSTKATEPTHSEPTTKPTEPKVTEPTTKPTVSEPPATEPSSSTPTPVEFTVFQNNESSSSLPPIAVFHGTATPGDTISVESYYGSTSTVAGEAGLWEAHLELHEMPANTPFQIGVRHNGGTLTKFWFTYTVV